MPEFPVLSFSFSRLKQSKHTKTSRKSFKALPEAVTGAPAFGFREVFCVSGNAMIHTDISLSAAAFFCHGKKKEQAPAGKAWHPGVIPFPLPEISGAFAFPPALCTIIMTKNEIKEAYDGFCEAGTGISEGM